MLVESPRFNAARRYGRGLRAVALTFIVVGAVLVSLALSRARLPLAIGYLGAALWTAAAAFLSSDLLSIARQRLLATAVARSEQPAAGASPDQPRAAAATSVHWRALLSRLHVRLQSWLRDPQVIAGWPPALVAALAASLALAATIALWRAPLLPLVDPMSLKVAAGALIAAAFPLLVLERLYAGIALQLLPEAPQLNRLLRLPLATCLALAIELILRSAGFGWAAQIERVVGLLIAIVSLELILRCATILFVPFVPIEQRQSLADSRIAGAVLRLGLPSFKTISIAMHRQLGIDLSRSWALAFVQKAALAVLVGIGLFAWAITGVTVLNFNSRGIYERLGAPVAVFGPGLHVHLPWPLGKVTPVEYGVIHLLPIEFLLPGGTGTYKSARVGEDSAEQLVAAEAPAPESADRLWSGDHPFEGNYLIASGENGRQSFQLVNIDMAVIYRVGLSEQAARDAAYRITDIDALIQALSGQLLVRYFTRNTLLELLGASRETFAKQFQTALQEQLDRFSTGIEAIGVSVEAIHPPPGAASAYHDVQAAQIRATTQISIKRGEATRSLNVARQTAAQSHNEASSSAAERVSQAQAQSVLFTADRQAYAQDGYPFLLERWLDELTQSLANSGFVLIDHRINAQNVPWLDLRGLIAKPAANPATAPSAVSHALDEGPPVPPADEEH